MRRFSKSLPAFVLTAGLAAIPARSTTLPIGAISLDPYQTSGSTFDITNLTGLLSSTFPDTSAPVVTQLAFSDILLTIDYQNGAVVTESATQFTDDGFGGFSGNFDVNAGDIPILSATLTGSDSPNLVTLNDGNVVPIAQMFSATVMPGSCDTLVDGDAATIEVTLTPEPAYAGLLGVALAGFGVALRKRGPRHAV